MEGKEKRNDARKISSSKKIEFKSFEPSTPDRSKKKGLPVNCVGHQHEAESSV